MSFKASIPKLLSRASASKRVLGKAVCENMVAASEVGGGTLPYCSHKPDECNECHRAVRPNSPFEFVFDCALRTFMQFSIGSVVIHWWKTSRTASATSGGTMRKLTSESSTSCSLTQENIGHTMLRNKPCTKGSASANRSSATSLSHNARR